MPHSLSDQTIEASIFDLGRFSADDWGITPGVNDGILDLAQWGAVRRISILANAGFVSHRLDELKRVPGLEFGLHWNMTHGHPREEEEGGVPFRHIVDSVEGRREYVSTEKIFNRTLNPFKRKKVFAEAHRNLAGQLKLLDYLKIKVTYLDSHQHVHLIPGMLDHVAPTLLKYGIKTVRLPLDKHLIFSRRGLSYWLAMYSKRVWKKHGFVARPCVYPFADELKDVEALRQRIIEHKEPEVIVHPAKVADFERYGIKDSYREQRLEEYATIKAILEGRRP